MGVDLVLLTKWEGINDGTLGSRESAAGTWFAKMGGWEKNKFWLIPSLASVR